ncbi:Na+/H+ antiporter [Actinomycetospora termitidis]|uniref:Na+/H+ antiporter n=1 Tax=Actinomycetospora termitidis TaxID=3053470 RepID=A0ABT7M733_9PSEU|nr:Na+/H+ antiporter [Actinomycetospora sp. Odt1-22]MDL5155612.1 Na+/H+ antiporter [Actinomycetospora sp. Odt1-22]
MYDPAGLTVLVLFGVAILVAQVVARRTGINGPILLLVAGAALAAVPATAALRVPPELVVLLFLPALLYWESLTTSLQAIRADLRSVVLSSIFLVLATAGTVAAAAHVVLGLSWPVGFVLGAIVAPTDATAVAAVGVHLPRRQLTMLRAESLVNDGTAFVLFAAAVAVASGAEPFSTPNVLGDFALSYLGGIAIGVLLARLAMLARRVATDALTENVVSVLTPFAAFLLAEEVHASGVLAVVVCGLALSRLGPRSIGADTRLQAHAFWQIVTFLLNATLFLLIGLQLPAALATVSATPGFALAAAALVAAVVVVTRLVWMNVVPYLVRALDRRPAQRGRRIGARQRLPLAWAGFRGAVSLAIALAVPLTTVDGAPFPHRDLLLVVTFGVILVTLVGQGLTLPAVVRAARYDPDTAVDDEIALAYERMADAALADLPRLAEERGVPEDVVTRLRAEEERRRRPPPVPVGADGEHDLRLALVRARRRTLLRLRDAAVIDDQVLLRVQSELDVEELALRGGTDPG